MTGGPPGDPDRRAAGAWVEADTCHYLPFIQLGSTTRRPPQTAAAPDRAGNCCATSRALEAPTYYSFSNPWLVNFSVRLFSVTVRTT